MRMASRELYHGAGSRKRAHLAEAKRDIRSLSERVKKKISDGVRGLRGDSEGFWAVWSNAGDWDRGAYLTGGSGLGLAHLEWG